MHLSSHYFHCRASTQFNARNDRLDIRWRSRRVRTLTAYCSATYITFIWRCAKFKRNQNPTFVNGGKMFKNVILFYFEEEQKTFRQERNLSLFNCNLVFHFRCYFPSNLQCNSQSKQQVSTTSTFWHLTRPFSSEFSFIQDNPPVKKETNRSQNGAKSGLK